MKFGVNTFIWGAVFGPSDFPLLPRIKEAGFDGIELPIIDPGAFDAAAVGRELDRLGFERTAVSIIPAGLSLASPDASLRQQAREHMRRVIGSAREAGATLLSGPFYTPVGYLTGMRRTPDEWAWVVESWQQLGDFARDASIEIGLEPLNRFETYFLNTASDAVALCEAINQPAVGILLDTFHANIEEKSIGTAVRRVAPWLKHLHACENDRGIPGSGHVEWDAFFDAVTDIGYDRWLTIESFGFSLGAMSAAAAIWRDLAPTPESIAFDGVAFLRDQVRQRSENSRFSTPPGEVSRK